MLGTIVNTAAIIVGSIVGLFLKGGIPKRMDEAIMKALGLSVVYVGISGSLKCTDTLLLILSLVIGVIIGEYINLDSALKKLGKWIEDQFKSHGGKEGGISEGFVASGFLGSVLVEAQITNIGAIGSVLIIALGLNMLEITRIKVANFLPAIFIPILYYVIQSLV